ncbi:OmpA family protein, partial [Lutibacter sp. B1]|uniref:OmpA family protein n=1 Tax=Lutibacter sp. B1 TaxID=2725996 RepID=UPI001456AFC1
AFSFNIKCENTYKIVADNNEYNSNTITFETDKKRDISISKTLELTKLDCNQIVNGSILDKETKLPLANTQVTLFENNNEVNKITTDYKGAFSFNIKCENTYKIVADNNEYNSNTITFETDKKRDISISKTLELTKLDCNQIVNGSILDKETKLPLANTQVTLFENNNEVNKITTDYKGAFSLNLNCNSNYKIVANNEEYNSDSVTLNTSKIRDVINNITINLSKKICSQTITGIIRDKTTKNPLPNTTISLYKDNEIVDTYTVGNDGIYLFKLECSSNYKLTVFKNNYLESFKLKTSTLHNRTLTLHIDIEPSVCVQYINGIVRENITDNFIPNAKVILYNNSKEIEQTITDSNGSFYFEIECNKTYTVYTEKINYTKTQQNVISSGKSGYPHNIDLAIEPIIKLKEKNGIKYIETNPILFELDEYKIIDGAKTELNKVIFNMHQNPAIKIEVNYHTDSRGPDDYNLELTINRANATKDYLVSKGIDPDRIIANGYGETRLLNNCKNNVKCSDAEHEINRRTEFIVIKN